MWKEHNNLKLSKYKYRVGIWYMIWSKPSKIQISLLRSTSLSNWSTRWPRQQKDSLSSQLTSQKTSNRFGGSSTVPTLRISWLTTTKNGIRSAPNIPSRDEHDSMIQKTIFRIFKDSLIQEMTEITREPRSGDWAVWSSDHKWGIDFCPWQLRTEGYRHR